MSDVEKFSEIFEYLREPLPPEEETGVVVFGRHDLRLVDMMSTADKLGWASYFVVTGALGKDSHFLHELKMPEAKFLAAAATAQPHRIPGDKILVETEALNGGDNARNSMRMIDEHRLLRTSLTALCHATSLRRLAATLEFEGGKLTPATETVYRLPTNYPFDPTNIIDQYEAVAEFKRLVEWPNKGMLLPQLELPEEFIEFALDTEADIKASGQKYTA